MNAIDQAKELYRRRGWDLAVEIGRYLDLAGVVHCDPEHLLLARPIALEAPDRWAAPGEADAWFIELAVGERAFNYFLQLMPYYLPSLAWRRMFRGDDRLHVQDTSRFINFNRRTS